MNWKYAIGAILIVIIGIAVWAYWPTSLAPDSTEEVRATVLAFGGTLKSVSLLAPSDSVKQEMDEQYTPYVSAELLAAWEEDPTKAPGRLTSSPFPQGIYIASILKQADGTYRVDGTVQEVTNVDTSAIVDTYGITMTLRNKSGSWKIVAFEKGTNPPSVPQPSF